MSSWQMFFLGGGKCPNLGVVNVRILGVVNVLLANDSQSNDLRFSSMVNKPNEYGDTALMYAVLGCNHTAVAKLLLNPSVDMDLTNNDGESLEDLARY